MNEEQQQKVVDCLEHWRVVAAMNNISDGHDGEGKWRRANKSRLVESVR